MSNFILWDVYRIWQRYLAIDRTYYSSIYEDIYNSLGHAGSFLII